MRPRDLRVGGWVSQPLFGLKPTVKPSFEGFAVRFCTFKGELRMAYLILLAIAGGLSCALILATGLVRFVGRFVGYKLAGQ